MKKTVCKLVFMALVAGMLPLSAHAADDDLQKKLDRLTKEVEDLKGQVKRTENKSLGKWLDIGGEYRFRVDSLHGKTVGYTDVLSTFANAQNTMQSNFFNRAAVINPADGSTIFAAGTQGASDFWQGQLGTMMTFSQSMANVKTFDQARAFLGANAATIGGLMNFAVQVPAYKPQNETLYTNKFGLDLAAKPIQDITVHAKLDMYKVFGSQEATPALGNYFADRVGVFDGTLSHVPSD